MGFWQQVPRGTCLSLVLTCPLPEPTSALPLPVELSWEHPGAQATALPVSSRPASQMPAEVGGVEVGTSTTG